MIRLRFLSVVVMAGCAASSVGLAQATGGAAAAQGQPPAAAAAAGPAPTVMMEPAISTVRAAVDGMHADKWKIPGVLRDETETNLGSIRRDLDGQLPLLLANADKTAEGPGATSGLLPAYRNVEALYDVVLRVDAAARIGAPGTQSQVLDQALAKLDEGRRGLGDRLVVNAQALEKQVTDLQASLKAAQNVPPPPAPVCPAAPAAPAKKPAPKKPAAKPATPPAATTPPSK